MKEIRFLADRGLLVREVIAAWVILFFSVIVFATLSTLLSMQGLGKEQSIAVALVIVGAFDLVTHVILHNRGYLVWPLKASLKRSQPFQETGIQMAESFRRKLLRAYPSQEAIATSSIQVYHHHWLAFWKPLAGISFLLVLSIGGALVWLPLGLSLVILALIGAVSVYLSWSWHTFTFTAGNRLVRRRGFLGCTKDAITLYGVVTPYQIPVLGQWLDMGNVYLELPGPDIHIRHIANFRAFYGQLVRGKPLLPKVPPEVVVVTERDISKAQWWIDKALKAIGLTR